MRPFINRLVLKNFRAFERAEINLAPLTILIGPNNSGKSSILSAIRLLSQTMQNPDRGLVLLWGELGTFRDVVHKNKATRIIGVEFEYGSGRSRASIELNFRYAAQRREVVLKDFTLRDLNGKKVISTLYSLESESQVLRKLLDVPADAIKKSRPLGRNHFLPDLFPLRVGVRGEALWKVQDLIVRASRILRSVRYIGPMRVAPLRVFPFSGERPSMLSREGVGMSEMLVADYFRKGNEKRVLTNRVKAWLEKAQIAKDIQIKAFSDRHYEIKLQHPVTNEIENLADVGFGLSQVMPVVVAGYQLRHPSVFMVEQPELHLHPRAQADLGDFFLEMYQSGHQCIIETHSEHLLMRLQRYIASGLIPARAVAVNFVSSQSDRKTVQRLTMNSRAQFKKWPKGFFEERLEEAVAIARAPLERKPMKEILQQEKELEKRIEAVSAEGDDLDE
jgi:hypothetical protein